MCLQAMLKNRKISLDYFQKQSVSLSGKYEMYFPTEPQFMRLHCYWSGSHNLKTKLVYAKLIQNYLGHCKVYSCLECRTISSKWDGGNPSQRSSISPKIEETLQTLSESLKCHLSCRTIN